MTFEVLRREVGVGFCLGLEEFFAELAEVWGEGCFWRGTGGEGFGEEGVVGLWLFVCLFLF